MKSQLLLAAAATLLTIALVAAQSQQQQQNVSSTTADAVVVNVSAEAQQVRHTTRCSRQSIILARQTLMHEFDIINSFGSQLWLHDLDKEELMEEQKKSLGSIMMLGASASTDHQLLSTDGQPLIELEASYFRPISWPASGHLQPKPAALQPISLKLQRRHPDRCHLNRDSAQFVYSFAVIVGPLEHHLDVLYHLPRELRLSQPMDEKYGQVRVTVPKMLYEITVKQAANYKLDGWTSAAATSQSCPLEVADVTYLGNPPIPHLREPGQQQPAHLNSSKVFTEIQADGLAATNQTNQLLERFFNDYTRPSVSNRLRQALKFHLASKTLPLSVV